MFGGQQWASSSHNNSGNGLPGHRGPLLGALPHPGGVGVQSLQFQNGGMSAPPPLLNVQGHSQSRWGITNEQRGRNLQGLWREGVGGQGDAHYSDLPLLPSPPNEGSMFPQQNSGPFPPSVSVPPRRGFSLVPSHDRSVRPSSIPPLLQGLSPTLPVWGLSDDQRSRNLQGLWKEETPGNRDGLWAAPTHTQQQQLMLPPAGPLLGPGPPAFSSHSLLLARGPHQPAMTQTQTGRLPPPQMRPSVRSLTLMNSQQGQATRLPDRTRSYLGCSGGKSLALIQSLKPQGGGETKEQNSSRPHSSVPFSPAIPSEAGLGGDSGGAERLAETGGVGAGKGKGGRQDSGTAHPVGGCLEGSLGEDHGGGRGGGGSEEGGGGYGAGIEGGHGEVHGRTGLPAARADVAVPRAVLGGAKNKAEGAAAGDGKRTSGVEGVSRDQGHSRWDVKVRVDGRVLCETFSASVHGEEGALQAAIAYTERMKGGEGLSGKGEGGGALLEMEEGRGGQSVPPVVFHVPPECRQGGGVGQVRFVMGEHIQGRGKIWYDQRSEDAEPFEEYGVVHGGAEEEADGEEKDKEEEEEEIITGIVFDKNKNRWESFLVLPAPDEDKDGPLREVNIFYDVSSYGHDEAKERALQCRAEMERLRDRCLIFDPKIIRRIALEKFPPRPPKRKGGGKKKQGQQRPAEYPAVAAAAAAGVPQDRSQEPVNGPAGPAEPLQEEEEEQKEGGEKDVRTGMGSDTEKKAKRDSPEEKKTEKPHTRICRELMSLFGFNKGPVEKPEAIEKNASQAAAVRSSRRASSASPCPPPSGPLPKKKEGAPPAKQSPHPPSSASVQKKQKKKDGAPSGRLPRELLSLIDTSTHAQRRAAASVPPISARLSDGAAAAAARDGKRDSGVEGVSWDQKGSRWIAKGRLDGRVTLEKFPVSVHGETGVLQAAIAFREMMVGEEEKMHSRSSSVKRDEEDEGDNEGAENEEEEEEEEERGGLTGDRESGVTGVFWVGREHRRWVANIGMKGRQVYMYFPVLTHGDKEALKKAKECRAEMVRLRDNGCTDPEEMQQEIRRRFPVNSGAQEGGGVEEEEEEEEESEEEEEGGETEEDRIGGIRESGVTGVYWVGSHHIAWVAEIRTQNRPMRIQFPVKTHGERVALQKAKECRAEMLRLKENGLTDPEKMRQELRRKFPLGPVEVGGGEEEEEESEQEEEGEEESGSLAGNQESGVRGVRWVGGRHRAWKAEIRVQNRPMSLQFPISTHGDKEALQKAKECREEMERLKGMGWTDREKVRQELRRKFPLNSVSAEEGGSEDRGDEEDDEPVGVFWDCQNACWAAHIRIRGGQPKLSFPVKTYGKDGALKKAKECRREMEKMKEEGWTDLVSFRRELRRKFPAASGTVDGGRREEKEEEERERESGMKGVYWVGSSQRMWIAEIRILNSTVAIQFPLLSYGGDRRALQKAKECRTEMHRLREKGMTACEAIRKRLRRKFGQISKSSQKDEKAGMRGVKWDCHHACWVARVRFLGVQPKLSFPIKTHGENGALQKAKECRAEMEKQMKRKKWKNADEFREAIRRKFSVGVESGPRDDGGGRESPSEKKKKGGLNVGSQQRQKRSEVPLAKGERNLKRLKAKFKNAPAVSQFSSSSVVGVKWDKRNQAWEAVAGKNDQKSRRSGRRLKIQFLVSRFGEKEALERAMACRMEMERGERDLERLKEKFKNAPAISQSSSSSACASMGSQQKGKGKGGLQGGASACARKRQVGEASDSVCALPDPKRKKPSKRQEGKTDSDSSVVSSPARGRLPLSSGPSASLSRVALPRGASTAGQSSSLCTLKRRLAAPFLSVENRPGKERSSATSSLFGALKAEEGEDADAQRGGGAKRRKIQAPATGEEEDGEAMGDGGDDPIAFPSSSSSSSSSSCSSSSSESASRPLLEGGAGTGEAGLEQMGVEGGSEEAEGGRSHGEAVQKARDPEAEKALIAYAEKNRKPLMALLNPNRLPGTYTDKKTARDNRANRLARARAASEFTTVTAKTTRYLKARWCTPVILSGKAVAVIGDGVTVDTSMLGRVAGSGLFATKAFEEGDIVTEFVGYLLDRETAMRQKEKGTHSHIMTLVKNHSYLMCLKDVVAGLGGAHFANDGTVSKNGKPAPGVNAKNFWYFDKDMACTRVFLKATKRIEIGQEIFISYGEVYWR